MINEELIKNLKALKGIKPRLEWVRATRQNLFSIVESQDLNLAQNKLISFVPSFESRSIRTPYIENKIEFSSQSVIRKIFDIILPRPKLIWRFAAAFLILFSISFVSLAKISEKSLPGDNLYPLKLALEKTSFVFTFSNEEKAKLHTQLAERRVEEFTALVKITDSSESNKIRSEKIKVVFDELKKELDSTRTTLEKTAGQESRKKTISLAKTVEDKTVQLEETLTKAHEDLPASIKSQVKTALKETVEIADKTNLKALEILAAKASEDPEISSDEKSQVKSLIEAKIERAEGKIEAVNESTSSSKVLSDQAKETLNQAKESLNKEDLSGAVEKVVVSGQIVQVAEKIIDSSASSAASSDTSATPESQNNTQALPSNNSSQEQPTDSTNSSTNTSLTPAENKVLDNNSDNSNNTDNAPVTNNPQLRINLIE